MGCYVSADQVNLIVIKQLEPIKRENKELNAEVSDFHRRTNNMDEEIKTLKQHEKEYQKKIKELSTENKNIHAQLRTMENSKKQYACSIRKIQELEQKVKKINNKINQYHSELGIKKEEIHQLRHDLAHAQLTIQKDLTRISQLESKHLDSIHYVKELREEINKKGELSHEALDEANRLKLEKMEVEARMKGCQEQIEDLRSQIERERFNMNELEEVIKLKQLEIQKLQEQRENNHSLTRSGSLLGQSAEQQQSSRFEKQPQYQEEFERPEEEDKEEEKRSKKGKKQPGIKQSQINFGIQQDSQDDS